MSLWSISASKKKEEVPGTSKWIRNELFTLHDLMINDLEQFAYSVASEFTWIDEQMEDILTTTEPNPRLLLESPQKLKGVNSPVKKLREEALAIKSPLKELDMNISRLSPIRLKENAIMKPSSPIKMFKLQAVEPDALLHEPATIEKHVKPQTPFTEETVVSGTDDSEILFHKDTNETRLKSREPSPQTLTEPEVSKDNEVLSPVEASTIPISRKQEILKQEEEDDNEYDASVDENSFQAIKSAIRKSIILQKIPSREPESTESSFKSATDETQPATSLVANQGSIDTSKEGDSVETLRVPLNDDNAGSRFEGSRTPPRLSHRESQGFALLPHRGPLTVKSAKKKDSEKSRKSLFDDLDTFSKGDRTEKSTATSTITTTIFPKSLYPSLELAAHSDSSGPTATNSPSQKSLKVKEVPRPSPSPSKVKQSHLLPSQNRLADPGRIHLSPQKLTAPSNKTDLTSPNKGYSPLSTLFTSVGSTLKRAKSKFIKESQAAIDGLIDINDFPSPSKKERSHQPLKLPDLTATTIKAPVIADDTAEFPKEDEKKVTDIHSPIPRDTFEVSESAHHEDVDVGPESLKFSPVKSIYGSLRRDMNKAIQNSPVRTDVTLEVTKPLKDDKTKRSNLARTSLAKPSEERDGSRKSFSKGGGLASMSLDPSKSKSRPKSFTNEQHGIKRKSQDGNETRSITSSVSHQPTRKIGAKIVAPSVTQLKQSQHDAKRRRTAEQLQNVLQKKAARVSNVATIPDESKSQKPKPLPIHPVVQQIHTQPQVQQKYQAPNTQTLMKTAVLQNARMNNETKNSPFNPPINNSPASPATPVALPEIFSESDDDEEGNVLKDWANSPELRNILLNQQHIDPDKVFGPIAPLHMEEIFRNSTTRISKLKHRGSSAQWTGSDALTIQEIENYKKRFKR